MEVLIRCTNITIFVSNTPIFSHRLTQIKLTDAKETNLRSFSLHRDSFTRNWYKQL